MRDITNRTNEIYEYIKRYKSANDGLAPTMREMADRFETSTSVISYNLDRLEERGLIRRLNGSASRGIIVVGGCWTMEGS